MEKECNQNVTVFSENNPNRPKLFQLDFSKYLIYKYSKMMGNRLVVGY
jgi:hypothetical protein